MLFVTYAYFLAAPSWNENSRFDLTRSLVERRSLDIDPHEHNTGDRAFRNGHYFSDKAPGASLLAIPTYAAYWGYLRVTGGALPLSLPDNAAEEGARFNPAFRRALYLCNVSTNALAGAILGALFFLVVAAGAGGEPARALVSALALSLGTLCFPYATMFYGHVVAAAFLFASFACLGSCATADLNAHRLRLAGLFAAAAVTTELTCAGAFAALAAYACLRLPERRARVAHFFAGALVPAVVLAAYQTAAFGHPFRSGYAFVAHPEFAQGMNHGFFGIGAPSLSTLGAMLFGRARGLLYVSPVLVLGFVGLVRGLSVRSIWRREAVLAAIIVAYFLLLNAGYYMWFGGSALGPRHVIPMLPFLCLGIPHAVRATRRFNLIVNIPLAISVMNQLAATSVGPEAPLVDDVLGGYVYPHFIAGGVPLAAGAANLGGLIGLAGAAALIPLLLLWILALWILIPMVSRPKHALP